MKRVVSAAIRINTEMVTGKNHSICISKIKSVCQQGFLVEDGMSTPYFVDREEALEIAIAAGQKISKHHPLTALLSEDLYEDPYYTNWKAGVR